MKKLTALAVKVVVFSALIAQLAYASDAELTTSSSFAEPIYLSLCGLVLLVFGMMKGKTEKDS